jgi:hypothetical protein
MFVEIFEVELGDAGFVEFAETFGNNAIVLFLVARASGRSRSCLRARALE